MVKIEGVYADFSRGTIQPFVETLDGAIALRAGDRAAAKKILTAAASRLRAAPGPDAWMQALFGLEGIAQIGRDAGDWDLVEFAAAQMREHDPAYAGAHYLLAQVARQKGEEADARRHLSEAKRLWSHADTDLAEMSAND
jgi:hypothetical protein